METLFGLPFKLLEIPPMRLKKPSFIAMPSAMMVYGMILVSYFLVLGGVIYDIIIEPPSIGQVSYVMIFKNILYVIYFHQNMIV